MARQARLSSWSVNTLVVAAVAALGLMPSSAQGQRGAARSENIAAETLTAEMLVADQLVIIARQVMAGGSSLSPARLDTAGALLSLAVDLQPRDAELRRLWVEWARLAGNDELREAGLEVYTKLRPHDDRAALELIRLQVRRLQTVEQRMQLLERLVTQSQGRLGPALRSRLASMTALMAFDGGDDALLSRYLTMALQLDPTNAEAARLLLTFAQTRSASEAQIGRALVANLQAAPLDPGHRAALGSLLLSGNAYEAAVKQFDLAQRFSGQMLGEDFYWQWALALGWCGRVDEAVALLDDLEQRYMAPAGSSGAAATVPSTAPTTEPAGVETADTQPATAPSAAAGDARALPHRLETLRLVLLKGQNRTARVRTLANGLRARLSPAAEAGDPQAIWRLGLYLALGGVDLGYVADLAQRLDDVDAAMRDTLLGWRALGSGQAADARTLFEQALAHAAEAPAAELGLALARLDAGQGGEALSQLVGQGDFPDETRLMAASRLTASPARLRPVTRAGEGLARAVAALPPQIREPRPQEERWAFLQLEIEPPTFAYLEPIALTVTLQNATHVPLGLAPDGPLPASVLVQIGTRVGGAAAGQFADLVVDMSRRLRLEPEERVSVRTRLDWSQLGELLAGTPTQTVNMDAVGLLDLRADASGRIVSGPLGTRGTVRLVSRRGAAFDEVSVEAWLGALGDPDAAERLRALARLTFVAGKLTEGGSTEPVVTALLARMTAAVEDRFPDLDRLGRAMVVRFLPSPSGPGMPRLFETLHGLAQRSDDPLVRVMYLAANVGDPADPALEAAQRSEVAAISRFAGAWTQVLTERKAWIEEAQARAAQAQQAAQPPVPGR